MEMRQKIGIGAGLVWAAALLGIAALFVRLPVFTLMPTIMAAFLAPGLVLAAMIGCRAVWQVGQVVRDTVEQLVLAMAVWPAAAVMLGPEGPGAIATLGAGFALARLVFWLGCHRGAAALAYFGFFATFLPTVLVALWALLRVAT